MAAFGCQGGGSCGFAPAGVGWTKLSSADSPLIGDPLCGAKRPHSNSERFRSLPTPDLSSLDGAGSRGSQEDLKSWTWQAAGLAPNTPTGLTSTRKVALARSGSSGRSNSAHPGRRSGAVRFAPHNQLLQTDEFAAVLGRPPPPAKGVVARGCGGGAARAAGQRPLYLRSKLLARTRR